MPILDVEMVTEPGAEPPPGIAGKIADAAGQVFGTQPHNTWVKLRFLPLDQYAENEGGPEAGVRPVFVSVLKYQAPEGDALQAEIDALVPMIASACDRPEKNVHLFYRAGAAGRAAFGGKLID